MAVGRECGNQGGAGIKRTSPLLGNPENFRDLTVVFHTRVTLAELGLDNEPQRQAWESEG